MKIRYSYGEVGNNKISHDVRFPYMGAIGTIGGYNYGDLNSPNYSGLASEGSLSNYPGLHVSVLAADYLRWEVATKQNLGLDFNLWNNKISGAFDVCKEVQIFT